MNFKGIHSIESKKQQFYFIRYLYSFPMILQRDIFCINGLIMMILNIISQSDVKHIMTFLVKTIMSLLNVSTYIITIAALFIQMIMSVSTLVTAVILYLLKQQIVIVFNISLNCISVLNLIYIYLQFLRQQRR